MNKINMFRILSILTMGSFFLPIVFNNIPYPLSSQQFYLITWLIFLSIFHTKIFFLKNVVFVYLFIIIYFVSSILFWQNIIIGNNNRIDIIWILKEIGWTLLAIIMFSYFLKVKDYFGLGLVSLCTLIFILITSISSIVGLSIYPAAARLMAAGIGGDLTPVFRSLGIGRYGFFTAVAFLSPVFVYYLKNSKLSRSIKVLFLVFIIVSFYATIQSQLTTTLLFAIIFFVIPIVVNIRKRQFWFILAIFFLAMFVFNNLIADVLYVISESESLEFVSPMLKNKIRDIALTLKIGDYDPNSTSTYVTRERLSRSYYSFVSFLNNPFIGGGQASGHAHWLDRLGLFGIVGFLPWILIFYSQISLYTKIFSKNYKTYFQLSFLAFILFGLMKGGLESAETTFSIFFLAPSLFFLKYL